MKLLTLAALALLTIPAYAQPAETCLTKTLWGEDLDPPMCFVPERISSSSGSCEVIVIGGDVPHLHICEKAVPAPMPAMEGN